MYYIILWVFLSVVYGTLQYTYMFTVTLTFSYNYRPAEHIDLTGDEAATENDIINAVVEESLCEAQSPQAPPYSPFTPVDSE